MNNLKASENIKNYIKDKEELKLSAYLCPANVWTIGWGHTKTARKGMIITIEEAEKLFCDDLNPCENAINKLVTVPINQNQFDALVSFVFNVGVGAFRNSTLLRLLNQGNYNAAALQFKRWNKANGVVLAGLSRRRKYEEDLFVTPVIDDLNIIKPINVTIKEEPKASILPTSVTEKPKSGFLNKLASMFRKK